MGGLNSTDVPAYVQAASLYDDARVPLAQCVTFSVGCVLFQVSATGQENASLSPDDEVWLAPTGLHVSALLQIAPSSSPIRWPTGAARPPHRRTPGQHGRSRRRPDGTPLRQSRGGQAGITPAAYPAVFAGGTRPLHPRRGRRDFAQRICGGLRAGRGVGQDDVLAMRLALIVRRQPH
jgi:hypothetical protein